MTTNNQKGFTLVELLAVIVILAIILVIAVPQIMSTIKDSKKATLESTVKMIASLAEKQKVQNTVLGKTETITCESVAKLNDEDYTGCSIAFDGNTAKVTITGSGKFEGLNVCGGTRTTVAATEDECPLSCKSNEVYVAKKLKSNPYLYEVGNSNSCISYLKNNVVTLFPYLTETEVTNICTDDTKTTEFDELIRMLVAYDRVLESDLIENDIIKTILVEKCVPTTTEECFDFDSETGTIVAYYSNENNDKYQSSCPKDVVIPDKINGVKVKKIGECAFTTNPISNCAMYWYSKGLEITSVIMSEGIEKIGVGSFVNNSISNVIFPKSITTIESGAFYSNQISGELDLSDFTRLTSIGNKAFDNNQITSVKFPSSLVTLAGFGKNQIRGEIDLSNLINLESIVGYAFYNNQIAKVKLPSNISIIDNYAFRKTSSSNPNLTTIINPSGKSFDWYNITNVTGGTSATCTFATGTCGSITISAN